MRTSFYTYFSSGYATLWFIAFFIACVARVHLELGWVSLFGFPIAALMYAAFRRAGDTDKMLELQLPSTTAPRAL
jgi:hypothetical protein